MEEEIGTKHSVFDIVEDTRRDFAYHAPPSCCVNEKEEPNVKAGNNIISNCEINCVSMFSDAQYCYPLLEAMPLPGPTWSTTSPSLLAEPLEGDCGEKKNQGSSYNTWWLGFLEGLDENMACEKLDYPFLEDNSIGMEQDSNVISNESPFSLDELDVSYYCLDDWLMIPTMEKDLRDMDVP